MVTFKKLDYDVWCGGDDQLRPIVFGGLTKDGAIGALYVDPPHRLQGLGRQMVGFLIEEAKRRGLSKVMAVTHEDNLIAQFFFTQIGFTGVHINQKYIFEKEL
jgi:ribosomal protein S18 acetylase RimI-like enzyme